MMKQMMMMKTGMIKMGWVWFHNECDISCSVVLCLFCFVFIFDVNSNKIHLVILLVALS